MSINHEKAKKKKLAISDHVRENKFWTHINSTRHGDSNDIFMKLLGTIRKICNDKFPTVLGLSSEKRYKHFKYTSKFKDFLHKVNNHSITLLRDKQRLKKILGDLFTYGSFTVLIITSIGVTSDIDVRIRNIIQNFGALFTIGSTALKVKSETSLVKTISYARERAINMGESFGIPVSIAGQEGVILSVLGVMMTIIVGAFSTALRAPIRRNTFFIAPSRRELHES